MSNYLFPQVRPSGTNPLFWQHSVDYLKLFSVTEKGRMLLVMLNYFIWYFLLFVAYLLVSHSYNIFWQLLLTTLIAEIIEKLGKEFRLWRRPMFFKHDTTPPGLIARWYNTGSFPSGHTIKAVYFFLFILQYQVINPIFYLLVTLPLLTFRVLVGFHYPIDMLGGIFFGWLLWFLFHQIVFPPAMIEFISFLYRLVFPS